MMSLNEYIDAPNPFELPLPSLPINGCAACGMGETAPVNPNVNKFVKAAFGAAIGYVVAGMVASGTKQRETKAIGALLGGLFFYK